MNKLYKEGDTFYYILHNYDSNEYYTMAYEYHKEYDHCFYHSLMFKSKEEAENRASELNIINKK